MNHWQKQQAIAGEIRARASDAHSKGDHEEDARLCIQALDVELQPRRGDVMRTGDFDDQAADQKGGV